MPLIKAGEGEIEVRYGDKVATASGRRGVVVGIYDGDDKIMLDGAVKALVQASKCKLVKRPFMVGDEVEFFSEFLQQWVCDGDKLCSEYDVKMCTEDERFRHANPLWRGE